MTEQGNYVPSITVSMFPAPTPPITPKSIPTHPSGFTFLHFFQVMFSTALTAPTTVHTPVARQLACEQQTALPCAAQYATAVPELGTE